MTAPRAEQRIKLKIAKQTTQAETGGLRWEEAEGRGGLRAHPPPCAPKEPVTTGRGLAWGAGESDPHPTRAPRRRGILSDALRERVGQRPRQRSVREGGRVSGRRGAGRWRR